MTSFIEIYSTHGRVGRLAWVNAETRYPIHYSWTDHGFVNGGWWGCVYWAPLTRRAA